MKTVSTFPQDLSPGFDQVGFFSVFPDLLNLSNQVYNLRLVSYLRVWHALVFQSSEVFQYIHIL